MASAARRPEGFLRSNRREGAQTRDAPSGLEVLYTGQCSSAIVPERNESAIFFFSFDLGHTWMPSAYLSNVVGIRRLGLAFGHSECDKESLASRPPSFTICHENM